MDFSCEQKETGMRPGLKAFLGTVLGGLGAVSDLLAQHFPAAGENPNELPDAPLVV